jgi:ParB family chromosome partitioning protein
MSIKKGLGKGLEALLGPAETESTETAGSGGVLMADIRKIEPNSQQPRRYFDEEALAELADSIKVYGIIQPLIVKDNGTHYSIIAGERRYRAARLAGLAELPVIVKDYSDMEVLQIALIENIQRQDLTPIEEALCYKRLVDDFFYSPADIAEKIGKSKHAVTAMLQLLALDERVQSLAAEGQLTASHAKVLLQLKDGDDQLGAAEQIIEKGLSVRGAEALILQMEKDEQEEVIREKPPESVLAAYRKAEEDIKLALGAKVVIKPGKKKGKIEIEYYSPDELERLLTVFKQIPSPATFV